MSADRANRNTRHSLEHRLFGARHAKYAELAQGDWSVQIPVLDEHVSSASAETSRTDHYGSSQPLRELVFIDESVSNIGSLIADLEFHNDPDTDRLLQVIVLDSHRDGIARITSALVQYRRIERLHFVSRGADGVIRLGSAPLSAENLSTYQGALRGWRHSMRPNAELLFYGCSLAESDRGRHLMQRISHIAGCRVTASDMTGIVSSDRQDELPGDHGTNGDIHGGGTRHETVIREGTGRILVADPESVLRPGGCSGYRRLAIITKGLIDGAAERMWLNGIEFSGGVPSVFITSVNHATCDVAFDGSRFVVTRNGGGLIPHADLIMLIRSFQYEHQADSPEPGRRDVQFLPQDSDGANVTSFTSVITVAAEKHECVPATPQQFRETYQPADTQVGYGDLLTLGETYDLDCNIVAFVVRQLFSGTLRIGTSHQTATPFVPGENDIINLTHHAWWTPTSERPGSRTAFTVATADDLGMESVGTLSVRLPFAVSSESKPRPDARPAIEDLSDAFGDWVRSVRDSQESPEGVSTPAMLTGIDVTLSGRPESEPNELLFADTSGTSLQAVWDHSKRTLSILGAAAISEYQSVLQRIRYENLSANHKQPERTLSFTAGFGTGSQFLGTTSIRMTPCIHTPVITPIPDLCLTENRPAEPLVFSIDSSGRSVDPLNVTASSSNVGVIPNSGLRLQDLGHGQWSLEITPARNQFGGPVAVTVTVQEGTATAATTFSVTVMPRIQKAAVGTARQMNITAGSTANTIECDMFQTLDASGRGQNLVYTLRSNVTHGTLMLKGVGPLSRGDSFTQHDIDQQRLTYSHDGSASAGDNFAFELADGGKEGVIIAVGTFRISIRPAKRRSSLVTSDRFAAFSESLRQNHGSRKSEDAENG